MDSHPLLINVLPDFAIRIRNYFISISRFELVPQVDHLRIKELCNCGEPDCGSFYFSQYVDNDDELECFEFEGIGTIEVIGGKLGYGSSKAENALGVDTTDETTLTVGAFGRYYATPSSQFSVFGNLGFDYMSTDDKLSDVKVNGYEIALSPGVSYFLNSNFAMEASFGKLGYSSVKADVTGAEATNSFGLNLDLRSITFGLVYKF